MKLSFPVSAPPDAWAALADPAVLAAALPGCRTATPSAGDRGVRLVVDVAVASVRGLWAGTAEPLDADAVRIVGSGEPGRVDVVVRADAERSTLTVEGTVDGRLAAVGSTLLSSAIRRLAEDTLAGAASTVGSGS